MSAEEVRIWAEAIARCAVNVGILVAALVGIWIIADMRDLPDDDRGLHSGG